MSRSLPARLLVAVAATLVTAIMPHAARAAEAAVVTLVEGEASVVRDVRRFALAEGVRLQRDDIVHTSAGTRLVRLETSDGSVIDLGPASAALIAPRAFAGGGRTTAAYIATGWAKWTSPGLQGGGIATPRLDVSRLAGTVVLNVAPGSALVFVESGRAEVQEHDDDKAAAPVPLAEGDAWRLRDGRGERLTRPPAELAASMPRVFADTLPRRAARWQAQATEPGPMRDVSYDEVARWINAEPALRPLFLARFGPLVRDKVFRARAVAELRAHPEWKNLLFPPPPPLPKPKPVIAAVRPAPVHPVPPVLPVGQRGEQAVQSDNTTSPEAL